MGGSVLICAVLAAGAAPVLPVAPAPRLVKPDVSLIVSERVDRKGDDTLFRVLRIGFRNGKPLPAEVILECDPEDYRRLYGGEIRANRYLVSMNGSVLDLRGKGFMNRVEKFPSAEDRVVFADDTKVTYWTEGEDRANGLFTFEYATGTRTRIKEPKEWMIPPDVARSPDGTKAMYSVRGALTLHREGKEPKSLGTDFNSNTEPVLWLDNDRVLTQREAGKLVTVSVDGKVTEVVTIKDLPPFASIELVRDPAGSVFLDAFDYGGQKYFQIDLAKKTAVETEWHGLGHGFEAAWAGGKIRHGGKGIDVGKLSCAVDWAVAAQGHLAVPVQTDGCDHNIAVWSVASGKWTRFDFPWAMAVLGWIK